ncbi:hypothetical protein K1719_020679 [Acacia pycnantha]|nr:hypothetical protein K1719_020679 [Acacia pycnantha]
MTFPLPSLSSTFQEIHTLNLRRIHFARKKKHSYRFLLSRPPSASIPYNILISHEQIDSVCSKRQKEHKALTKKRIPRPRYLLTLPLRCCKCWEISRPDLRLASRNGWTWSAKEPPCTAPLAFPTANRGPLILRPLPDYSHFS